MVVDWNQWNLCYANKCSRHYYKEPFIYLEGLELNPQS